MMVMPKDCHRVIQVYSILQFWPFFGSPSLQHIHKPWKCCNNFPSIKFHWTLNWFEQTLNCRSYLNLHQTIHSWISKSLFPIYLCLHCWCQDQQLLYQYQLLSICSSLNKYRCLYSKVIHCQKYIIGLLSWLRLFINLEFKLKSLVFMLFKLNYLETHDCRYWRSTFTTTYFLFDNFFFW